MNTYKDFVTWAGGNQAKAGSLIGIDKYRSHRLYQGKVELEPSEAAAIEKVSYGIFKKENLINWEATN